jgi:hypothetical protein
LGDAPGEIAARRTFIPAPRSTNMRMTAGFPPMQHRMQESIAEISVKNEYVITILIIVVHLLARSHPQFMRIYM